MGIGMEIPFSYKRFLDSSGRQAIRVFISDDEHSRSQCERGKANFEDFKAFLHKILTETLHQRRLTNRHDPKEISSFSKYSIISFKQSVGSRKDIFFVLLQETKPKTKTTTKTPANYLT